MVKHGFLYSTVEKYLESFDLVLFRGGNFAADAIIYIQKLSLDVKPPTGTDVSHVGMIVRSDILDHPGVLPGKTYILESTMSMPNFLKGAEAVPTIEGDGCFGVQLRQYEPLIRAYDRPDNTAISIGKLLDNPAANGGGQLIKAKFTEFFKKISDIKYDFKPTSLFGAAFPCCRCMRDVSDEISGGELLFCSELIALVYKEFGILPQTVDPRNVIPMDFIPGLDRDGDIGQIIQMPIVPIVSSYHFNNVDNGSSHNDILTHLFMR